MRGAVCFWSRGGAVLWALGAQRFVCVCVCVSFFGGFWFEVWDERLGFPGLALAVGGSFGRSCEDLKRRRVGYKHALPRVAGRTQYQQCSWGVFLAYSLLAGIEV